MKKKNIKRCLFCTAVVVANRDDDDDDYVNVNAYVLREDLSA